MRGAIARSKVVRCLRGGITVESKNLCGYRTVIDPRDKEASIKHVRTRALARQRR